MNVMREANGQEVEYHDWHTKRIGRTLTQSENNCAEYEPSETQQSTLEAFQATNYLCTVVEGCEAAGLTARSFYLWFHEMPGFSEWWSAQADLFFSRKLPKVQGALFNAATGLFDKDTGKHNSKAQELFLQRYDRGFVPRSRKEIEHSGKVGLDVSGMTDADLERMEHTLRATDDGSDTDT